MLNTSKVCAAFEGSKMFLLLNKPYTDLFYKKHFPSIFHWTKKLNDVHLRLYHVGFKSRMNFKLVLTKKENY